MSRQEVQSVVDTAIREAILRRHEYITVEHLLYSILQHDTGVTIISACGGDVDRLLKQLLHFFAEHIPELPVLSVWQNDSAAESERETEVEEPSPVQTLGFRRVLERAVNQGMSSGRQDLDVGDLLAGIFLEQDSHAVYLLKKQGITRLDILNYISHGMTKDDDELSLAKFDEPGELEESEEEEDAFSRERTPQKGFKLESFAVNLTELARQGKLDPLIGREREMKRVTQVLCRRLKHNPVLVGEPGVGKTAIVEGLAQNIVKSAAPKILHNVEIFALDMGALLAGTKFRGQFEQRLKAVLKAINKYNRKAASGLGAILFVDEIHTIVGAGATTGTSIDASGLLKHALHADNLRCIGATTHDEYRRHFEHDRALVRRFQKIDITEASVEDSIAILHGLRNRFEEYYQVQYTDPALESAAQLAFRHIAERFMPDKAIDVIDEVGALNQIREPEQQKAVLDVADVEEVVGQIAHIPDLNPGESERDQLAVLERKMKEKVFGQNRPIEAVSAAIRLSRAGLNLPDKPVGAFLFAGPTGVGKTEVARQLALVLGVAFKRFDMSEYMEKHTVSRLIGAPPGYIGYDQGGLLTEAIRKNPHCVLLLDEIEKAHIDLFDILLQVMDHATLTDNTGREADFRNVILIMTTNAGAREMGKRIIGFDQSIDLSASHHAIEKLFSPEFRNRLTEIVYFDPLSQQIMIQIVGKFIDELNGQLAAQEVRLELDDAAKLWLAEHGYDEMYGARPLARLIQTTIRQPLAEEILFGQLQNGGVARVTLEDEKLVIHAGTSALCQPANNSLRG
ncbi:ATP-dependent Clp protease ATP-binding subunit ClpA [Candidatus Vecturithrix granuli]|uniref:ATP-dependent Clp protease ATP-binding subunit ClpA n=1 Tax=Vecturithrix granuli TaxID=1499967 RepID=A0A081C2G7_VECG1|nr:ATP-dependent Clp protease ATP-binding subunit ClpA [Candidatus Vecturithrix granuli]